jgi:hypothetical protein
VQVMLKFVVPETPEVKLTAPYVPRLIVAGVVTAHSLTMVIVTLKFAVAGLDGAAAKAADVLKKLTAIKAGKTIFFIWASKE